MECILSFSHSFNNKNPAKNIYSSEHFFKRIHVLTSPNTICSAIEYRINAQFTENCLKIMSDQKRQNTQVTIG